MSMGSSGTENSGTKGTTCWDVEVGRPAVSIAVSFVGCELGICRVAGVPGEA